MDSAASLSSSAATAAENCSTRLWTVSSGMAPLSALKAVISYKIGSTCFFSAIQRETAASAMRTCPPCSGLKLPGNTRHLQGSGMAARSMLRLPPGRTIAWDAFPSKTFGMPFQSSDALEASASSVSLDSSENSRRSSCPSAASHPSMCGADRSPPCAQCKRTVTSKDPTRDSSCARVRSPFSIFRCHLLTRRPSEDSVRATTNAWFSPRRPLEVTAAAHPMPTIVRMVPLHCFEPLWRTLARESRDPVRDETSWFTAL
mmetsp:Transcript_18560/g.70197  ORF Transcript_18560/g.70197 Transcript_18560/m.70197 type:complete len:259 (+) Transcript_18560:483-1259(+)